MQKYTKVFEWFLIFVYKSFVFDHRFHESTAYYLLCLLTPPRADKAKKKKSKRVLKIKPG